MSTWELEKILSILSSAQRYAELKINFGAVLSSESVFLLALAEATHLANVTDLGQRD